MSHLHMSGLESALGCINPHHLQVCPFDSPWQSEGLDVHKLDPGPPLNLDNFMPLKDLMDADLHQLKSHASDQSGYTTYTDASNVSF